jgi:hypothetical protein
MLSKICCYCYYTSMCHKYQVTQYQCVLSMMSQSCSLMLSLLSLKQTVYTLLQEKSGLAMLNDVLIEVATKEILPDTGKSRASKY